MPVRSVHYKNNPFLPKAGLKKEITDEQREEIRRCMMDPVYFADTYFKIVHQDHGLVQMTLYDYQRDALKLYMDKDRLIMATARQIGKTSLATVIILHAALFNSHKNIALLANKKATAKEVLSRIKTAYENLPDWLKGGVVEWNKESVQFENGSKIFADASEGNSIRGQAIFLLYIDEAAFVENWEDFSASVLPTISANKTSKMILTSTPNGLNHFYTYCQNAKENNNGFGYIEVPWWKVDGRDDAWKDKTLEEMNFDYQRFAQEQEVEFMGSSGTLINGATLKLLKEIYPKSRDDGLNLYTPVAKDHTYIISVDTSRGKDLDYSAFQVIDTTATPYTQVCTFRSNKIAPPDYAAVIDRIARHYNEAYVLIELNDLGSQVADELWYGFEYPNLVRTRASGRTKEACLGGRNSDRGVTTTKTVKAAGCSILKLLMESKQLIIIDKDTIDELKVFSRKGESYAAEEGKHDDTVMPLVLFAWLSDQRLFKDLTDTDIRKALRERSKDQLDDFLLPFGIVVNGVDDTMPLSFYDQEGDMMPFDEIDAWLMN